RAKILQQRKIVPLWDRRGFWLAAACFAAALIVSALWLGRPGEDMSFSGFRQRVIRKALREYAMDIRTSDPERIAAFFQQSCPPADYALTAGLRATPVKGGGMLRWQNHPVSMVCFALPKNQTAYMFVAGEDAFSKGKLPSAEPVVKPMPNLVASMPNLA